MTGKEHYLVCALEELAAPGSKSFSIEHNGELHEGFFVRTADGIFAYLNHCPHTGASLNWMPDQFLTYDTDFIQCSIHGALFRLNDGLCIRGPCIGQKLQNIAVFIDSEQVFVDL